MGRRPKAMGGYIVKDIKDHELELPKKLPAIGTVCLETVLDHTKALLRRVHTTYVHGSKEIGFDTGCKNWRVEGRGDEAEERQPCPNLGGNPVTLLK